jgi:hypothetical protein
VSAEQVLLPMWEYVLLLVAAFAVGGLFGTVALYSWQEYALRREVDRLLQDLSEP